MDEREVAHVTFEQLMERLRNPRPPRYENVNDDCGIVVHEGGIGVQWHPWDGWGTSERISFIPWPSVRELGLALLEAYDRQERERETERSR
jgi:hypothetical protein